MTTLERLVAEFRDVLADHKSKFLLIYTEENPLTNTIDCRATSNSDQAGIRAIMNFFMQPTPETIAILAKALEDTARASAGVLPGAVDQAAKDNVFLVGATELFRAIRGSFTIKGWESKTPNEPQVS